MEAANGDVDEIIRRINSMNSNSIWRYDSPLWARPTLYQYESFTDGLLQIAGHTPVKKVEIKGNILLTDVFSTDGERPIGDESFVVVNVIDKRYYTISAKEI